MWAQSRSIRSLINDEIASHEPDNKNVSLVSTVHGIENLEDEKTAHKGVSDYDTRYQAGTTEFDSDDENNKTDEEKIETENHQKQTTLPPKKSLQKRQTDDNETTWYEKCQKIQAKLRKVRLILVIGVVAVNILVITYILLMYFFSTNEFF